VNIQDCGLQEMGLNLTGSSEVNGEKGILDAKAD
jgi:hypothetical protein